MSSGYIKTTDCSVFPARSRERIMRVLFAFAVMLTVSTTTTTKLADEEPQHRGWVTLVLDYLDGCRTEDFVECVGRDLTRTVDRVIDSNPTYRLNRYLTVTAVTTTGNRSGSDGAVGRSDDSGTRLLDFLNALHIRYEPQDMDLPTHEHGLFQGRKKNKFGKKHKMSMMMAATSMGMTIIGGMFTKMMMGGVSMIAVKALIIAKIAFLLAASIALKKMMHGGGGGISGGGGVISQPSWSFSGGGGGNEPSAGYRRSSDRHLQDDDQNVWTAASELAYRDQLPDRGASSVRGP